MAGSSLARNLAANLGGYAVSVAITLVITPLLVAHLGNDRYGAWSLIVQIVSYYGYFDIGIRGALSHYLARFAATGAREDEQRAFSTAFWALSGVGLALAISGGAISAALPYLFDFESADAGEAQSALLALSLVTAVSLPAAVFSSVLVAYKRFDLLNLIEIGTRVTSASLVYLTITQGGGLLALTLIQSGAALAACVVTIRLARSVAGRITPSAALWSVHSLKNLVGYGGRSSAVSLALVVIDQLDLVIVGLFLGVTWVTFYSIGASLVAYAWAATAALALAFNPHMVHLHAARDDRELIRLYLRGERLVGLFSSIVFASMLVLGGSFIELWLGNEYVSGEWAWRSDSVMLVLALAKLPRVYQAIARQLMFAAQLHRTLMWITLAEAAGNLMLRLLFVQWWGPAGVALGALIPCAISHGIVLPWFLMRTFHIELTRYLREAIGPPLLVGGALYACGMAISTLVGIDGWLSLAFVAIACTALGVGLGIVLGTTGDERRAATSWLVEKLRGPSVT